jgi:hypothetical protein
MQRTPTSTPSWSTTRLAPSCRPVPRDGGTSLQPTPLNQAEESPPAQTARPRPVVPPSLAIRPSVAGHRARLKTSAWARSRHAARRTTGMRRAGSLSPAWPIPGRVGRGLQPRPDFNRPQTTLGGRLKSPEKTKRWVASLPHVVSGRVEGGGKGLAGRARGPRAGHGLRARRMGGPPCPPRCLAPWHCSNAIIK